jgi:hypothetical protein
MSSAPVITYTRRAIRKEATSQLAYLNTCRGQDHIQQERVIGCGALTVEAMETNYNQMERLVISAKPRNAMSHLTGKFDAAVYINEVYDECKKSRIACC